MSGPSAARCSSTQPAARSTVIDGPEWAAIPSRCPLTREPGAAFGSTVRAPGLVTLCQPCRWSGDGGPRRGRSGAAPSVRYRASSSRARRRARRSSQPRRRGTRRAGSRSRGPPRSPPPTWLRARARRVPARHRVSRGKGACRETAVFSCREVFWGDPRRLVLAVRRLYYRRRRSGERRLLRGLRAGVRRARR